MDVESKYYEAYNNIYWARTLISYAQDVSSAQYLLKDAKYAPNLNPVADWLLMEANANMLYKAEKALDEMKGCFSDIFPKKE